MIHGEKFQDNYRARINRFMNYLGKVDPNWSRKRSWFEDLNTFELGENFYEKVVNVDGGTIAPEDKSKFFVGTVIYAKIEIQKKFGNKAELLECGFEIESELDDNFERKKHESLLGYLWWIKMYKHVHKERLFTQAEEDALHKKRKTLMKQYNRIFS